VHPRKYRNDTENTTKFTAECKRRLMALLPQFAVTK